jgi:PilZ domain-containing protein
MFPTTELPKASALLLANPAIVTLVKRVLLSHGFDVLDMSDVGGASNLAKQRRFDLAVYDEDVRGALELADNSNTSLHRVAIGLVSEGWGGVPRAHLHFVMRKPLDADLLGKTVKAAFAPIAADRRSSFRHDTDIPLISTLLHNGRSSRSLSGVRIVNLSLTGVCLEAGEMLPQQARVELVFQLPGDSGRIRIAGRVVWSHSSGRSGVQFTAIHSSDQHKLEDWADTICGLNHEV